MKTNRGFLGHALLTIVISLSLWFILNQALLYAFWELYRLRIIPFNLLETFPRPLGVLFAVYLVVIAHALSLLILNFRKGRFHQLFNFSTRALATSWVFVMRWFSFGIIFLPTWWIHQDPELYPLLEWVMLLTVVWLILDYGYWWRRKLKVSWRQSLIALAALLLFSILLSFVKTPGFRKFEMTLKNDIAYQISAQRPWVMNGEYFRKQCGITTKILVETKTDGVTNYYNASGIKLETSDLQEIRERFSSMHEKHCIPQIFLESDSITTWKAIHPILDILYQQAWPRLGLLALDDKPNSMAEFGMPNYGLSLYLQGTPKEYIDSIRKTELLKIPKLEITIAPGMALDTTELIGNINSIKKKRILVELFVLDETQLDELIPALDQIQGVKKRYTREKDIIIYLSDDAVTVTD